MKEGDKKIVFLAETQHVGEKTKYKATNLIVYCGSIQ